MVDPRTVMESSVTVSRFLAVYLTARSAVFILGETEAIVPLMMVPASLGEFLIGFAPVETLKMAQRAFCPFPNSKSAKL